MLKLIRSKSGEKFPEVSIVLSTSSSFFIFFLLHGCIVLSRHSLDVSGFQLTIYQSWMLKVLQSLFWLVAFFWHFARAALVLVLDSDLKDTLLTLFSCSAPASSGCGYPCCPLTAETEAADDWKSYSPHRDWVLEQSLIQQRNLEASQIAGRQQKRPLQSLDLESEVPLVTPSSWEPRELQSLTAGGKYVIVPTHEPKDKFNENSPLGGVRIV